ncbi:MAG: prephenate dehydrogenase/arogenate dehydrogenase family protein [Anaerolineales bacterium]|nr:prephenate dehydrogenase/arogenate dehydrogenase family protein [Anaerolineales bacterium]
MDETDFISNARLAIIGLGLMGGSLAMALQGKCAALLGVDADPQTVEQALRRKIVHQASDQLEAILPEADVIILATPVRSILSVLQQLPRVHPGQAVVMDLGSTKREIIRQMETLPQRFEPVGGHPMCGKEQGSLINAESTLFQDATFVLTPLERSSPRARSVAEQIVQAVGANPIWLDAELHDRWAAATSHLPYLAANALAASIPPEARVLVGPGLRSTTRLAPSSLPMMLDILATNRDNVLESLRRFRQAMDQLEAALLNDQQEALQSLLSQGSANHRQLMGDRRH